MPNPLPENVRLWLYLIGTAVLVVASGGVLPPEYLRLATTVAAVLTMLAAANVSPRPSETTPVPVEVVNEPVVVTPEPVQAEDGYEPRHAAVEGSEVEGEGEGV